MTASGPVTAAPTVVVLAAGKGTRMRSDLPKPLHAVGGAPMIAHALAAARALSPAAVVVVVSDVEGAVAHAVRRIAPGARLVEQAERLGTGHAVHVALSEAPAGSGPLIVLPGDAPLVRPEDLAGLLRAHARGATLAVLGFPATAPCDLGRLRLGRDGRLAAIIEAADDPDRTGEILCNSGALMVDAARAREWVRGLRADPRSGEFRLTDLAAMAAEADEAGEVVLCAAEAALGVNDPVQLAAAEAAFQARARREAMARGVRMLAPDTVYLAYDTALGRDVEIGPFVVFGPGVSVAEGARIAAFSHLERCAVSEGAQIGPFARLRPGAEIGEGARVGNFVEVKNAVLERGAKVSHLSYVGDAWIGAGANLGAGTVTCNYDGLEKHRTRIGGRAFIGSNTSLVAPVAVGAGAIVGAGSTITEDVPSDALALARGRQCVKPGRALRLRAGLAGRESGPARGAEGETCAESSGS